MIDKQWLISQAISLFMVVFGSLCLGVASHFNWPEMKTAGAGIIGAGIQSITQAIRQRMQHDPADLPPGGVQTDTTTSTIAAPPVALAVADTLNPASASNPTGTTEK